jgi:alpha-tubulin suppressor-like RCC1 family protein
MTSFGSVSAGGTFTCGLTTGGAYCWGDGRALGDGSTTSSSVPMLVTGGLTFYVVTTGAGLNCGLTTTGAPYCWGNAWGSLDSVPVAVPGGTQLSAVTVGAGFGPDHACGLTATGAAYCWGNNHDGQLGDGTTSGSESYIGWPIRRVPVPVVGGLSFVAMSAGGPTCGLSTNGTVYCWGDNGSGQLGNGSTTSSSVPVAATGGLTFSAVSVGFSHTCGLTTSGAAYCWGDGITGELGDGSMTVSSVPVAVSGGLTFSAITAGGRHTCGITTSGAAYCWGLNDEGQLGAGVATAPDQCPSQFPIGGCSAKPAAVAGGLVFGSLSAGNRHSCGLTVAGMVYCWGYNYSGQLGDATTTNSNVPVKVAGQP